MMAEKKGKKSKATGKPSKAKKNKSEAELVHAHDDGVEHAHLDGGDPDHKHVDWGTLEKKSFGEPIEAAAAIESGEVPEQGMMGEKIIDGLAKIAFPMIPGSGEETPEERDERLRDRAMMFAAGVHHGDTKDVVVAAAKEYFSFLKGDQDADVKVI